MFNIFLYVYEPCVCNKDILLLLLFLIYITYKHIELFQDHGGINFTYSRCTNTVHCINFITSTHMNSVTTFYLPGVLIVTVLNCYRKEQ